MAAAVRQLRSIEQILKSQQLEAVLLEKAKAVTAVAAMDPNPVYVASLDAHVFVTDRVVAQVGAAPHVGVAVEAKRGTLPKR